MKNIKSVKNLLPGPRRIELRMLAVGEPPRERSGECFEMGDVGVTPLPAKEPPPIARGANVNRVRREKMPRLGSH